MNSFYLFLVLFVIFTLLVIIGSFAVQINRYKKTGYYQITKLSFFAMQRDKGRLGEYETYRLLKSFEKSGARFLFNVYLPKGNDETTEIDVLMIGRNGIFVFESKNYSGWIFGDERQKIWTQTLPSGRGRAHKEHFLNPVWQNKLHIEALRQVLGDRNVDLFSLIVFSDRCELKKINLYHNDICVIHRRDIVSAVNRCRGSVSLSDEDIAGIYSELYPYTQISEEEKRKHIDDIQRAVNSGNNTDNSIPETIVPVAATVPAVSPTVPSVDSSTDPPAAFSTDVIAESAAVPSPETDSEPALICPKCGAALVLRRAKRGANAGKQFYGCSNYPKCKYIK